MLNLKSLTRVYNRETRSYAELLPWFRPVTPGLVLCMDGSLLAAFEYVGLDVESSDEHELAAALDSIEFGFRAFDDHNIVWTFLDKRRKRYLRESAIQNEVARYVDEVWRHKVDDGTLGSLRHVIHIAYQPFGGLGGFFDEVGSRVLQTEESLPVATVHVVKERLSRKSQLERMEGKLGAAISAFERQLANFMSTVSARLQLTRLTENALLTELANRANPASPREKVSLPDNDLYFLNTLLPCDSVYREGGGILRFDGSTGPRYVSMHSVKGYPGVAQNQVVEALLAVRSDFTLVQMFRFLDRQRAQKYIQTLESHYRANVKGPIVQAIEKLTGVQSDRMNLGMAALADDAQAALVEATVDEVGFGYHAMAIQVLTDDRGGQDDATRQLYAVLGNAGYGLVKENVNLVSAFSLTLPGAADAVLRQTLVSTRNLSDLTVVRTLSSGSARNNHLSEQSGRPQDSLVLLPTRTDVPEHFNLHVGDVGHFFIVGPAGAGKTTFINFLLLNFQRYWPCRIFAIDKDYSNFITITSLGGQYVTLKPGETTGAKMSPMRWANAHEELPKLRRWLEIALTAFDSTPLDAREIQLLDRSLEMVRVTEGARSLSALYHVLDGQNRGLAARLTPWLRGNRYGDLFDNDEDTFALSDICGIEVGGLLADDHLAPAILAYVFEVVEESVDSTMPTLIYLEEAWYLLANPVFRARFEDYVKTMRKRNAAVGLATQSLADIRKSPISATLNDNIKTRIFLPNTQAFDSIDIYREMLGLRDDEVNVIRNARQKREYYIVQEGRRRLVDVHLPPEILALTRADPRAKDMFRRALEQGGDYLDRYMEEILNG